MSDDNHQADRERFGEASLGEAEAEGAPDDPEMVGDEAGPDGEESLTDVPALDPAPVDPAEEQAAAAAAEAREIGGHTSTEGLPPEQRALVEGGEGEAEGFELAEEQLIENASHGDSSGHPLGDRFPAEEAEAEGLASYGEADEERVSEHIEDDR